MKMFITTSKYDRQTTYVCAYCEKKHVWPCNDDTNAYECDPDISCDYCGMNDDERFQLDQYYSHCCANGDTDEQKRLEKEYGY